MIIPGTFLKTKIILYYIIINFVIDGVAQKAMPTNVLPHKHTHVPYLTTYTHTEHLQQIKNVTSISTELVAYGTHYQLLI